MDCKYLYIDDAETEKALGTITGLEKEGVLKVNHIRPMGEWDKEITQILEEVKNYSGLILDQRLDEEKAQNGAHSPYRGTSVAQEIRVLVKENRLNDLPIVLLSAEANISGSFDSTGADLFDHVVSKEDIGKIFPQTRNILVGLCEGYQILAKIDRAKKESSLIAILQTTDAELGILDPRFVAKISSFIEGPSHAMSKFIINNLFKQNGIFITEELLAARLGIERSESNHWPELLNMLGHCQYRGVFHQGWPRWWMNRVNDWWDSISPEEDLRTLTADARIKIIAKETGLTGLIAPQPIELAKSHSFWVICEGTQTALNTTEGLLIADQDDLFPWQERRYVSYYAALHRTNSHIWKNVSVLEEPKLTMLQNLFKKERVRRQ